MGLACGASLLLGIACGGESPAPLDVHTSLFIEVGGPGVSDPGRVKVQARFAPPGQVASPGDTSHKGIGIQGIVRVNGTELPLTPTFVNIRGRLVDTGQGYVAEIPEAADGKYRLEIVRDGEVLTSTVPAQRIVFDPEPAVIRTGQVTIRWKPEVDFYSAEFRLAGCEDRTLVSSTATSAVLDVTFPSKTPGVCTETAGYVFLRDANSLPLEAPLVGEAVIRRESQRPVTFAP
jgi:hypothetical protein